jgi:WD40 repeat protein
MLLLQAVLFASPVAVRAASPPIDFNSMGVMWENKTGHNAKLWSVRWSPDGSMLSAIYFDNTTVIFNSTTGKRIVKLGSHPIAPGSKNGMSVNCDGQQDCPVPGHLPSRVSAWSPDGKHLAVGGDNRLVFLYDTTTWQAAKIFSGHRGSVLTLDFSPDSKYLASGSGTDKVAMNNAPDENVVKIWDVANGTLVKDLWGHKDGVMEVKWSPNGSRLISVSDDKSIRLWDRRTWSQIGELKGHVLGVLSVDFSPNGTMLVTGSRDYTVRLWDMKVMAPVAKWDAPNCVRSVDWHPSAGVIAASGVDETMLSIRNASNGATLRSFTESAATRSAVMSARWSPDGKMLAAGAGKEHALRVYASGLLKEPGPSLFPPWMPGFVAFSVLFALFTVAIVRWGWRKMQGEWR